MNLLVVVSGNKSHKKLCTHKHVTFKCLMVRIFLTFYSQVIHRISFGKSVF